MLKNDFGISQNDLPLGFGMALAKNLSAMEFFAALPESERQRIIDRTHSIKSKEEMQEYVNSLTSAESGYTLNGYYS